MKPRLDRIDVQILQALQKDARLSNKLLAAEVGLAPSSCLERVRRLQARGVLQGFHAAVDPAAMGIDLQAMLAIRLREHHTEASRTFVARVKEQAEVLSLYSVAGQVDFQVHVAVRDTAHLQELVGRLPTLGDVAHIQTALIFEHHRAAQWPDYTE